MLKKTYRVTHFIQNLYQRNNVHEYEVNINVIINIDNKNIYFRYQVRLPDHDFSIGSRHLLTPSVISIHRVDDRGKIRYNSIKGLLRTVL